MSDLPEEQIIAMFDDLFAKDPLLRQALGETNDYTVPEKMSIL